jgi:hypothetical protein
VIVLHGLTASVLRDEYPVDPETVLTRAPLGPARWERLERHPDDWSYEAKEPARVRPSHLVPIGYAELVEALRSDLAPAPDREVPVYPFAYDWRDDVFTIAPRLGAFIHEVIGRTRLLPHYASDLAEVDLVGHSMGGVVISACLAEGYHRDLRGRPQVRRVATLGTAYQGAVDALEKLTVGESELMGGNRDAERHMARLTPAVYQHVPAFKDALLDESGTTSLDAFDPRSFQHSVFSALAEHLRLFSRNPDFANPAVRAQGAFAQLTRWLEQGRKLMRTIGNLDPKEVLLDKEGPGAHPGWLLLVGLDEPTRYQAQLGVAAGERVFHFKKQSRGFEPGAGDPADSAETRALRNTLGDGTVPVRGAVPAWADRERVVGLARRDFGSFENLLLRGFTSLHSVLPWLNLVHRWVVAFLKDKQAGKADVWGRPLPDVRRPDWKSPVGGARLKP